MTISLALCVQLVIASAVGAGLVAACRWLWRRSSLCASVVVAGLLLRAAVMLILFWTSYLDLPVLRQQHTGDGFWNLAIDATNYYQMAVYAVYYGLDTVLGGSPSPVFVKALAVWMQAVGVSPVSGAYFNLALYVLLCLVIVAIFRPAGDWRTDLPCGVMLAAVSFSPVLLIYGSQPLKDTMFVWLISIVSVAAYVFLPWLTLKSRSRAAALGTSAVFVAALYVMGGIRPYYAVLSWSALALVMFVFLWRQRPARIVPYLAMCGLLLAAAWISYTAGAGLDYINPYVKVIDKAWTLAGWPPPARPAPRTAPETAKSMVDMVDTYRTGFAKTPGGTNVARRPRKAARPVPAGRPMPMEAGAPASVTVEADPPADAPPSRLSALAIGLGLLFVPVSVLQALSIVDLTGGGALLAMSDLDTVFMDLTIVAAIALVVRRRALIGDRLAYVCFAVTLAVSAAVLMGYIVTNFGTMFRLRLMVAAPIWMLPLVLSRRTGGPEPPADRDARLAARTQASFGYEWTHFHRWQDSGDVNFRDYFETADLEALRGARVLDAGCGMGRHAREMAAHARHVVAVDFSRAIEQAATNTRGAGHVDCVRADLLRLPFPDGTFDYVYSIGVLHHLGNTETAVRGLVTQLKPGGRLRVYLYWKRHGVVGVALRVVNVFRAVTTRLPFRLLRWLCWMLSAALWVAVILPYRLLARAGVPGIGRWPLFVYTKYPFRILYNDQFDRFSAPLEKRYDPEEVSALLESAGLRDVKVEARFGWVAEGVKPVGQDPCAG